jgi:protein phosphatase
VNIRDDIVLGQCSDVGRARTENQDFFGYWEPDEDRDFDVKGRLVVVCDGMGGHAGGEIASRLAVQTIIAEYQKDSSGNVEEGLRHAIEAANAAIQAEGRRETKLAGMGSTCTALVHRRDMVYFGQVGDSRGYLIRNGKIKQMTKDHSLVQELVDQGLIDKSDMESHPDKNVILRSLGVKPTVDVDVSYVPAVVGDVYLICSDGLSGPVSEQEMLSIVTASQGDLRAASERLIELANRYGGFDNITVQLVKIDRTDTATTDKTDAKTLTANFSQDEVEASIAKARTEAVAKGKKVPAAPAAKKAEKSEKPEKPERTAAKLSGPGESHETAAAKTPSAKVIPKTEASHPAASLPAPAGGGGAKLLLGLVLGLALGGGAGFVAARAGKGGGATGGDPPKGVADAVAPELAAGTAALEAAQDDMKRSLAEKLAPDAFRTASQSVGEVAGAADPIAKLGALRTAAASCTKAANAARAALRENQAREAREAAETAEKKASAKTSTPVYKKAQDEWKAGEAARAENDTVNARAHYLAAATLFELASQ